MTRNSRPAPAQLLGGLAPAVALALAVLVGLVPGTGLAPAGAHEGDAVVVIEETHPAGLQIHYIVRVTWADDGHPATDATVTATAVGADDTQLTPVVLAPADDDGRYAGVLDYPEAGTWTVRITSIEPTGSVEQAQQVEAPPPTEAQDAPSEVTTGSGDNGSGFAPADDGTGGTDGAATREVAETESSGSGMPVLLIVAAAVVVVVGAVTAVNLIGRNTGRRPGLAGSTGTPAAASGGHEADDGTTPAGGHEADGSPAPGDVTSPPRA